jgi:hypothetical protein
MFEEWESFGIRIGQFGVGFGGVSQSIRYTRTEKSNILRIQIDLEVKREEIKARLVKPGLLEIEWPRGKEEEIPIE